MEELIEKRSMSGTWPHVTVAGLVMDEQMRRACVIYRGENVRSAKNRWALLTGLLEHGESIDDALRREAEEELGIPRDSCRVLSGHDGFYQNFSDGYHWVLLVRPSVTSEFDSARNAEPDKHDRIEVMGVRELFTCIAYKDKSFDSNADEFLLDYLPRFF